MAVSSLFCTVYAIHQQTSLLITPIPPFSSPFLSSLTSIHTLTSQVVDINSIPSGWMGLDIGPKTLADIQLGLADCKTGENNIVYKLNF